eukprot:m.15777 g.15777  ORF g.15777 m.15777 type:complete len:1495 (+) comp26547_c0_seq1:77-4561(+)
MANCAQSAHDFIRQAFGPRIAVIASPDAETICQKNNLSFVDMLKPFCRPSMEGQMRDPQHQIYVVKSLLLHMSEAHPNPPPMNATKKRLNDVVARCHHVAESGPMINIGDMRFSASTPWFEVYRKSFCENMRVSDHEFLRHYVACIFVVSTNHPNPMEEFTRMSQKQVSQMKEEKYPKYLPGNHVFFYRLLLHDIVEGNETKVQTLQNELLTKYGPAQCHTLKINSRSPITEYPAQADPWSQYIFTDQESAENLMMESNEEEKEEDMEGEVSTNGPSDPDLLKEIHPIPSEAQLDKLVERSDPLAAELIKDPLTGGPTMEESDPLTKALRESRENSLGDLTARTEKSVVLDGKSLRSGQGNVGVVHGQCLTLSDHDRLRAFVNEFANRGLLPFIEKSIKSLSQQTNTRKGFQRTVFSFSKKWFGGGAKPSSHSGVSNYLVDSNEMQMRLLGDLAFLGQNYDLAYSSYHTCKRDFQNDHAWIYYAGALEMAATSLLMQAVPKRDPINYFEESIAVYLNPLKLHQFATRATLLATEYMKSKGLYRDAAAAFIKMTGEDSDLRGGLLLEQAAHCFLRMQPSLVRKYAFHLILSGHRFSKAYQRKHAIRMYSQALEIYRDKSWSLAEDHINLCLGHQSYTLKQLDDAEMAFRQLLSHKKSLQSIDIQRTLIKEFLYVFKQHLMSSGSDGSSSSSIAYLSSVKATKGLPFLPLPHILSQKTRVLLTGIPGEKRHTSFYTDNEGDCPPDTLLSQMSNEEGDTSLRNVKAGVDSFESLDCASEMGLDAWKRLEEVAVTGKSRGMGRYAVHTCFDNGTDNSDFPVCVEGEKILVEMMLENPLQIRLFLGKVTLLWEFKPREGSEEEAKDTSVVSEVLEEFFLPPATRKPLRLSLTPLQTGMVNIIGIVYNLKARGNDVNDVEDDAERKTLLQKRNRSKSNVDRMLSVGVRGKQLVYCRGPRLNRDKKERAAMVYGPDYRLSFDIVPATAQLKVTFSEFPEMLLCGEVKLVQLELSNCGKGALRNVRVMSSCPQFFSFGSEFPKQKEGYPWHIHSRSQSPAKDTSDSNIGLTSRHQPVATTMALPCSLTLPGGQLDTEGSVTLPLWIYGCNELGVHHLGLLFVYDVDEENPFIKHRVLRHTGRLTVVNSLKASIRMNQTLPRTTMSDSLEEQLAFLSLENVCQSSKERSVFFQLLQLSSLSRQWCLKGVAGKPDNESIRVQPKETFLLGFRTSRLKEGSEGNERIISNILFEDQEIVTSLAPCLDLFLQSPVGQTFGQEERGEDFIDGNSRSRVVVNIAEPGFTDTDAKKAERSASSAGLIVLWRAVVCEAESTRQLFGQSNALLVNVSQDKADVKVEQRGLSSHVAVLRTSLSHSHCIKHDFNQSTLCFLPVRICVQNVSRHDCKAVVNLLPMPGTKQKNRSSSSPEIADDLLVTHYTWVGYCTRSIMIDAQEKTSLVVHACFSQPGIYDLSRLRVEVVTDVGNIQTSIGKSFVTVDNFDSP